MTVYFLKGKKVKYLKKKILFYVDKKIYAEKINIILLYAVNIFIHNHKPDVIE